MKDKQVTGASFGGSLLICLLSFTLIMTFSVEVSCLLKFTLAANSVAHTLQFSDGNLILYLSKIRKFVTHREHTYIHTDRQTEKAITKATLIPWIVGLSGPIFYLLC